MTHGARKRARQGVADFSICRYGLTMSFIMEALKKADRERKQQQRAESMGRDELHQEQEEPSPPAAVRRGGTSIKWLLSLAVMGGLGYVGWSEQERLLALLPNGQPETSTLAPRPSQLRNKEGGGKSQPLTLSAKNTGQAMPPKPVVPEPTSAPPPPVPEAAASPPAPAKSNVTPAPEVAPATASTPAPVSPSAPVSPPPAAAKPAPAADTKPAVIAAIPAAPATAAPSAAVATPPIPPVPPLPAVAAVPPPVSEPSSAIAITHQRPAVPRAGRSLGKVAGVHYGCIIEIRQEDNAMQRVRLGGIGCTESDNTFGKRVRRALAAMVFTKQVRLEKIGLDPDGQPVWEVFDPNGTSVNAALVQGGLAMAVDARYVEMENQARRERQGMWADLMAPKR